MTKLICGWCGKVFHKKITKGDKSGDRIIVICPHCTRVLPSSQKEWVSSVGRQHIHTDWKNGDVVT